MVQYIYDFNALKGVRISQLRLAFKTEIVVENEHFLHDRLDSAVQSTLCV